MSSPKLWEGGGSEVEGLWREGWDEGGGLRKWEMGWEWLITGVGNFAKGNDEK